MCAYRKAITATAENNAIRLTMIFNTKSKDGQDVDYECHGLIPVSDPACIDQKLCGDIEALAEETVYTPMNDILGFVTEACTAEDIEFSTEEDLPPPLHPRDFPAVMSLAEKANDAFMALLDGLIDRLGPNFVNNMDLQFETDTRINGKLIPKL